MTDFLERFLGELNAEQKQKVQAWREAYTPMDPILLSTRKRWQAEFLEVLSKSHQWSDEVLTEKLTQLYRQNDRHRAPEHRAIYIANKNRFFELLQSIQVHCSQPQYEHLIQTLAGYQQDFNELATYKEPEPMFDF